NCNSARLSQQRQGRLPVPLGYLDPRLLELPCDLFPLGDTHDLTIRDRPTGIQRSPTIILSDRAPRTARTKPRLTRASSSQMSHRGGDLRLGGGRSVRSTRTGECASSVPLAARGP